MQSLVSRGNIDRSYGLLVLSINVEKHILLIGYRKLVREGERRKDEGREGRGGGEGKGDERGGRQSEGGEYEANHAALLHAIYALSFMNLRTHHMVHERLLIA